MIRTRKRPDASHPASALSVQNTRKQASAPPPRKISFPEKLPLSDNFICSIASHPGGVRRAQMEPPNPGRKNDSAPLPGTFLRKIPIQNRDSALSPRRIRESVLILFRLQKDSPESKTVVFRNHVSYPFHFTACQNYELQTFVDNLTTAHRSIFPVPAKRGFRVLSRLYQRTGGTNPPSFSLLHTIP